MSRAAFYEVIKEREGKAAKDVAVNGDSWLTLTS